MPKVKVICAGINLGDGSAKSSKYYKKGEHKISDEVAKHWFTVAQEKAGHLSLHSDSKSDLGGDGEEAREPEDKPGKSGKK